MAISKINAQPFVADIGEKIIGENPSTDSLSISKYLNSKAIALILRRYGYCESKIIPTAMITGGLCDNMVFRKPNGTEGEVILSISSQGIITIKAWNGGAATSVDFCAFY